MYIKISDEFKEALKETFNRMIADCQIQIKVVEVNRKGAVLRVSLVDPKGIELFSWPEMDCKEDCTIHIDGLKSTLSRFDFDFK